MKRTPAKRYGVILHTGAKPWFASRVYTNRDCAQGYAAEWQDLARHYGHADWRAEVVEVKA